MRDYKSEIINVICNYEEALTQTLKTLILDREYDLVSYLVKSAGWLPQEVVVYIFDTLNKEAYLKLADTISNMLYDEYLYNEDESLEEISLGSKIKEILMNKSSHCLSMKSVETLSDMKLFIKENYKEAICKCGSDLLDPDGEGVYADVRLPFVFDRKAQCLKEEINEYEPINNTYKCCSCDRDITHLIEDMI